MTRHSNVNGWAQSDLPRDRYKKINPTTLQAHLVTELGFLQDDREE
jgi:hypothetical protein